jgi:hypothetical protein
VIGKVQITIAFISIFLLHRQQQWQRQCQRLQRQAARPQERADKNLKWARSICSKPSNNDFLDRVTICDGGIKLHALMCGDHDIVVWLRWVWVWDLGHNRHVRTVRSFDLRLYSSIMASNSMFVISTSNLIQGAIAMTCRQCQHCQAQLEKLLLHHASYKAASGSAHRVVKSVCIPVSTLTWIHTALSVWSSVYSICLNLLVLQPEPGTDTAAWCARVVLVN